MKVTLLQPVRHDGKAFDAGVVVDLPKDAALALVACGSAEEGGKGRAAKAEADAAAAAKEEAIAAAEKAVADAQAAVDAAADDDMATAEAALGAAMAAHANLEG